jgi:subtilisin family serine protease
MGLTKEAAMKKTGKISVLVLSLILLVFLYSSFQAQGQPEGNVPNPLGQAIPGRFIVVFHEDVAAPGAVANEMAARHGLGLGHIYSTAIKGFSANIPAGRLKALEADPRVDYIEPDLVVHAFAKGGVRGKPGGGGNGGKKSKPTTAGTATAAASGNTTIDLTMPYTGDNNSNNTYTVDYKLSGSGSWTNWVTSAAHTVSPYTATITGLADGGTYDVMMTYGDTDGVNGPNPQAVENINLPASSTSPSQEIPTGIRRIGADSTTVANPVDVDIAIIDTGIDLDHEDLNVAGGVNFSGAGDAGGDDDHGHGTHVAGIAGAIDNGTGVLGVAPGARLWAIKVLDESGSGLLSNVIAGIDWVTAHARDIEVANMSLSAAPGASDAFHTAIINSVNAGVFYAVAAGNNGLDVYYLDPPLGVLYYEMFGIAVIPAAYPEVATVSAMADSDGVPGGIGGSTSWGDDDTFAIFSNYSKDVASDNTFNFPGKAIDLAAPGVDILSTWMGNGYETISGTSMASPHVAGVAALYIAANGTPVDLDGDGTTDGFDLNSDGYVNELDVYALRRALIDAAIPNSPNGISGDPDGNPEPLLDAGSL